jgi:hypothetical protein
MSTTRKAVLGLVALLVVGGGVGYLVWLRPFLALANVGIGYVAKQMCSCVYVAERSFDSCRPDMMESMDDIRAELTEDPPGVRAFVENFGERRALYHGELGCALID